MEDRIAIILPVRDAGVNRHERLPRCLDSYYEMTENLSDIHLMHDEDECHIYHPIAEKYPNVINYCIPNGINLMEKINIHAIDIANRYKYVGFIGDDIVFRTRWESTFIDFLSKQEYGLAFANDLIHTTGGLATHPFINSRMILALGFFGCPAVGHHYFDNYWMKIVERLGQIKFFERIIMEHMHPIVGKADSDSLFYEIESNLELNTKKYSEYMNKEFENDIRKIQNFNNKKSLDLGCGGNPRNPFNAQNLYGIDIFPFATAGFEFKSADLSIEPIPYPDNYFDYVTAYDFLEHIPRIVYVDGKIKNPFIELMSEIWRVLKPNGILKSHTPYYPYPEAFQDPTHVNIITDKTVYYFTNDAGLLNLSRFYGFNGEFKLISQHQDPQTYYHLVWELSAVK